MSEPQSNMDRNELPEALIEQRSGWSLVWLIPILALTIGAWLSIKAVRERGPDIMVSFNNAEGLEVGKTRVKYKDVEVGKVKDIQLSSDLSKVDVTIGLSRSAGEHLSAETRFWIVRPRVGTSGISGLGTLISGIYIGMDSVPSEEGPLDEYVGLDHPPQIHSDIQGRSFTLTAEGLGSLDIGSPIYYRQIKVGEVTTYELDKTGKRVDVGVFITEPYDQLVRSNSRFWNASGFDLRLNSQGIHAKLESLTALLSGGIAFDTPLNLESGPQAKDDQRFVLYPNYASTSERLYDRSILYVMKFKGSLRGLNPGASVEYHGIKVGEVRDIKIEMDESNYAIEIPVLVAFQPERISIKSKEDADVKAILDTLVERGLRAQLKPGNLLTGQMYVELETVPDAEKVAIKYDGQFPEFPTMEATLDTITRNVTDFVSKIDRMPLLEISNNLNETVKGLKTLTNSPSTMSALQNLDSALANFSALTQTANGKAEPVMDELIVSLKQLSNTLDTAEKTIADDSMLYHDVTEMAKELSAAARSIKDFTDYLQRNPDDLIFGKDNLTR